MAIKDWEKTKSGYRKKDGEDVLTIKYFSIFEQYDLQLNGYAIRHSSTKQEILKLAKEYMRTH